MAIPIVPAAVQSFANSIYMYGLKKYDTLLTGYAEPVTAYAAKTYQWVTIWDAHDKGWISDEIFEDVTQRRIALGLPIDWYFPDAVSLEEKATEAATEDETS